MFENIGAKIKTLAIVITTISIIVSIIWGISVIRYSFLSGLLVIILGSLLSWVGSFILYGFGQLVENSDVIAKHYKNLKAKEKTSASKKPELEINPQFSYSCKYLTKTGSILKGSCDVCGRIDDLEYCSVSTINGSKGYSICQNCKDKFIANSEE